ncbi:TatD family hydrolase [Candidatus Riesia pediculischaeffi]|uniref:DNAse n=1 Tax=Candidatus Riesia pediculischaeffi TaxID=428411 RepID=A0A1V0HK90_9ENTR|nr:TatD family hydrolase [Candidatus Riesia pediculischaeffi]ARC53247.1 hypothetical protein AOQ87_00885 [Candidatus Riesia pediculischaeffi]
MFLSDSHCHLQYYPSGNNLPYNVNDVVSDSIKNNVRCMLSVSVKLDDFKNFKIRSDLRKYIYFSCGVHPLMIDKNINFDVLLKASNSKDIVAIGETGLDYQRNCSSEDMDFQRFSFLKHIKVAKKLKKPIIIHMRNSFEDVYKIVREEGLEECGAIIHCFTGNKYQAKIFLDLGMYISFSGVVTFQNSHEVKSSAKFVPMDRLMIETDSPYLSPVPLRGRMNKPSNLIHIADCVSSIKNIDISVFTTKTTENFFRLFKDIPFHQINL